MKIAICDDNLGHIQILEEYIDEFAEDSAEVDSYLSGEALLCACRQKKEWYHVIFLDMEMENLNGIETARMIREQDEHVIIVFVTSHTEYMQESFQCAPFRFLVKPVSAEEFRSVLCDIQQKLSKQRKVFVFTENKAQIRLFCDDILYCESQDHWSWIHTKEQTYKICKPLSDLEGRLDGELFCRVHKSFLVNLFYLRRIGDNTIELYHCEKRIPISRTYKKTVLAEYANFLERELRV